MMFKRIKDFYLDYFAYFNQNPHKKGDSHFSMIMHISFFLGINVLSVVLFLLFIVSLFVDFTMTPSRLLFLIPSILVFMINLYWFYFKISNEDKQALLSRKSKYDRKHFITYELITTIFISITATLVSIINYGFWFLE